MRLSAWTSAITRMVGALAASALMLSTASFAVVLVPSPFTGKWQSDYAEGVRMSLTIQGRPAGPFQILWTDSSMITCDNGPGVLYGTSVPDSWNPDLLQANLNLECLASQTVADSSVSFRILPAGDELTTQGGPVAAATWHRPQASPRIPPPLHLRVNYGDDWVESFYEGGHAVWVTVTEPDGVTPIASLRAFTANYDDWNGEPGFQSQSNKTPWLDADHRRMASLPDIQPGDWVFAWADNGASDQIQIGEIRGELDLGTDSIAGTVLAPWITEPIRIECLDWGSGRLPPFGNQDGGIVLANGSDHYSCSWAGEWNIKGGEEVGVGYLRPDGGWVSNGFVTPIFTVFPEDHSVEANFWPTGAMLDARIDGRPECEIHGTEHHVPENPGMTSVWLRFPDGCPLTVGAQVTVSDRTSRLTETVQALSITQVDKRADTVAGTADPGATVRAWVHDHGKETDLQMTAKDGRWLADFGSLGFDIKEGMCGRSEITDDAGLHTAVDWCIGSPNFTVFPEQEQIEGQHWEPGMVVHLRIDDPASAEGVDFTQDRLPTATDPSADGGQVKFDLGGFRLKPGDIVTLSNGEIQRTHLVQDIGITSFDQAADRIAGVAAPGARVYSWVNGYDSETVVARAADNGAWLVDFGSLGFDLEPGICGRSEIRYEDGSSTAVDWCVPSR